MLVLDIVDASMRSVLAIRSGERSFQENGQFGRTDGSGE